MVGNFTGSAASIPEPVTPALLGDRRISSTSLMCAGDNYGIIRQGVDLTVLMWPSAIRTAILLVRRT